MEKKEDVVLNFHGPFKFVRGNKYLFDSEFAESEGIYIWTIKNEKDNLNLVHYIGETTFFAKRHQEHCIGITGLNYLIFDPILAQKGIVDIIWKGLWRDKSVANLLDNYNDVSKKVIEFIGMINIYFAPTNFGKKRRTQDGREYVADETRERKHVEGCLGWNLRNKYPEFKMFYPDDNHIGTKAQRNGQKLIVNLPEEIAGIDKEQII